MSRSAFSKPKKVFNFAPSINKPFKQAQTNFFYSKVKLDFIILKATAQITGNQMITVKLLIDNICDFDWPENLHCKGSSTCALTMNVDHLITKRISKRSIQRVNFTFSVACDEKLNISSLEGRKLVFMFTKLDEEEKIQYCSEDIVVAIKQVEQKSVVSGCGFVV